VSEARLSLAFEPAAHWEDTLPLLDDAICDALERGALGIAIAAPAMVALGARKTFPLSGIRVATFAEVLRAPLYGAVVVCCCVETGEVRLAAAVPEPLDKSIDDGEDPGQGKSGTLFQLDLFQAAGIPQKPATWVIRVLLNDSVSNAVTVVLEPTKSVFRDPAAEALVLEMLNRPVMRALHPRPSLGPGLPSYEMLPESPPTPTEAGITLQIKRAQLIAEKPELMVRGSFLVRVLPRDVRPPPTQDSARMRGPRATGQVPMTLLAVASHTPGAISTPLVVPTYQPLQPAGDGVTGSGAFTFDYCQLATLAVQPHTLFLYAFAGTVMSNVAACAMVHPNQLHD